MVIITDVESKVIIIERDYLVYRFKDIFIGKFMRIEIYRDYTTSGNDLLAFLSNPIFFE